MDNKTKNTIEAFAGIYAGQTITTANILLAMYKNGDPTKFLDFPIRNETGKKVIEAFATYRNKLRVADKDKEDYPCYVIEFNGKEHSITRLRDISENNDHLLDCVERALFDFVYLISREYKNVKLSLFEKDYGFSYKVEY